MSDTPLSYPDKLEIVPLTRPPTATVRVPGSKSITNRALVLAALCPPSDGDSPQAYLTGALRSEDTEVMIECLRALGYVVRVDWAADIISVDRANKKRLIPLDRADLFVANSGTTMRFLTAMVSLGKGRYRLDGVPRMRQRPVEDLLAALRQLGVNAYSEMGNGCPPVIVETHGWQCGQVRVRGDISSQFLSGLLMAAAAAGRPMEITVEGPLVSVPYVTMTLGLLQEWNTDVEVLDNRYFRIPRGPSLWPTPNGFIEPDASAASYFWGAAAITGGHIRVADLCSPSLQGDVRFGALLKSMGCQVEDVSEGITVDGAPLHGIDIDMNDISDTVMTFAAVACFAEGPTTIRNVAHIRHKETDRLAALATELRRLGAGVDEFADGLTITPKPLHGAEVETYNDHRMAMSLALIGLRVPGVVIRNPGCVAKTYPGFFRDLEALREDSPQRHKEHEGKQ
jgi:3-phosphoshikimate 1-carboxyvinyltransferase